MITKRGKRVRAVAILLGLILIWWLSGHLWWMGDGYCTDTLLECMGGGK